MKEVSNSKASLLIREWAPIYSGKTRLVFFGMVNVIHKTEMVRSSKF